MPAILTLNTGRQIGAGSSCYVIAEIGSNHNGSLDKAKLLCRLAKQAGADAVKIQSFQVDRLINRHAQQNGQWQAHPAWEMLDQLTVPEAWHAELQAYCKKMGIDFFSAPFDETRVTLLNSLDVPVIKIASGDLTHHELLKAVGQTHRPVILSTGMAYLGEVEAALNVLREAGATQIALLHCVSLYPPKFSDMNLRAMATMAATFQVPVGLSDHTPGYTATLGAVALGGSMIEKHLTDDKAQSGPDHVYALDGPDFTEMVTQIRNLEEALGDGIKQPAPGEIGERVGARRAVYADQKIAAGSTLEPAMFKIVRHAYTEGIAAHDAAHVYGRKAAQDIQPHKLLTWSDVAG